MLLSVEHMDVAYGNARVVSDVSLNVAEGEMIFVVGRNGAGKTTLLKTIAGFMAPSKGNILFENREVGGLKPEQVARMGVRYVFQDKRVFSKLTVRENIQLAAYPVGVKLADAIDKVVNMYPPMTKFMDTKAGGLSGGQRQLLLLGRALVGEPKLLLIDEPTEGLAAGTIEEVMNVLQMIKGKISMIIVEQNLAVVSRMADRVYAMKEGTIPAELDSHREIQDTKILEQYL